MYTCYIIIMLYCIHSNDALKLTIAKLESQLTALTSVSEDVDVLRPEVARLQRELDTALSSLKETKDVLNKTQLEAAFKVREHEDQVM